MFTQNVWGFLSSFFPKNYIEVCILLQCASCNRISFLHFIFYSDKKLKFLKFASSQEMEWSQFIDTNNTGPVLNQFRLKNEETGKFWLTVFKLCLYDKITELINCLSVEFLIWNKEKRKNIRLKIHYGRTQWLVQWRHTITCFAPLNNSYELET